MRKFAFLIVVAMGIEALCSGRAYGQTERPERPSRSLFGSSGQDNEPVLTFSAALGAGYDSNILLSQNSGSLAADSRARSNGTFESASANLAYAQSRTRVEFGATIGSSAAFYPVLEKPLVLSHTAGFGASLQLSRRTVVKANQGVSYQPLYSLGSFAGLFDQPLGQPAVLDRSLGTRVENHLSSVSDVGLTHMLSRRLSLSVDYGYWRTKSPFQEWDVSRQTARGHFGLALIKGLGLRLGYGYSEARYGAVGNSAPTKLTEHNLDAGLDFNRALSLSRRVTLTFGTGTTAVGYQNQTRYEFVGNARLNREIGRTWNAALAYSRNVNVLETFRQPVLADSLTVGVGGLINRRLQFQSNLGMSIGNVGLNPSANGFTTYYGTSGLTVGLTRELGVGVSYAYYRYQFDRGVELLPGLSPRIDRQSVVAYLNLWTPLMQQARRPPNASR